MSNAQEPTRFLPAWLARQHYYIEPLSQSYLLLLSTNRVSLLCIRCPTGDHLAQTRLALHFLFVDIIDSRSTCQRSFGTQTSTAQGSIILLLPVFYPDAKIPIIIHRPTHRHSVTMIAISLADGCKSRLWLVEFQQQPYDQQSRSLPERIHPATRSKAAPNRARNMAQKNQVMQGPSPQPRPDHNNWKRSYHASETPVRKRAWPCRRGC
ncbi:hypothetical protein IWZ01DRAFT_351913 [Phyllosticta capitalensis]